MLDPDSDLREVQLASGVEELKRRLEVLLGAKPDAEADVSAQQRTEAEAVALVQRRERLAEAGGHLLTAAFTFLGEFLPPPASTELAPETLSAIKAGLRQCVETGGDGKVRLAVTLPGAEALDALASALAKLMAARPGGGRGVA